MLDGKCDFFRNVNDVSEFNMAVLTLSNPLFLLFTLVLVLLGVRLGNQNLLFLTIWLLRQGVLT
jgi:hypothetical protein